MIFLILLVSSLYSLFSEGAPVSADSVSSIQAPDGGTPFRTNYRPTIRIIWTCAALTFSSSWACIHPHVCGYGSTGLQRSGIRLRIFINALLFPDQFVGRACYEWAGSRALYKEMERRLAEMLKGKAAETDAKEKVSGTDAKVPPTVGGKMRDLAERIMAFVNDTDSEQAREDILVVKNVALRDEKAADEAKRTGQTLVKVPLSPTEQGATERVQKLRTRRRHMEIDCGRAQRLMAQELVEEEAEPIFPNLKKNGWTMVHAHFIHMGGVVFQGPDNKMRFKDFRDWTDHDIEAFFALQLSRDELQDLSKADGFAKAFVIIQCLSFVIQCIGRGVYGLPLIQLEIACLAFIASKVAVYAFWWHKPLNVACPKVIRSSESRPQNHFSATASKFPWHQAIFETLVTGDIGLLVFPSRGWDNDITGSTKERFPVNYYYKHKSWGKYVEPLGSTVPTAIFGVLYTIGWHGSFPTRAEMLMWRVACIAPAILALVLLGYFAVSQIEASVPPWVEKLLECVACFTIIVTGAVRLIFLVLPLLQLRDLPPLAHISVPWSDFIPHV